MAMAMENKCSARRFSPVVPMVVVAVVDVPEPTKISQVLADITR